MSQFLQMDVFFFVTTITVVILAVLAAFILVKVLKILGYIEDISRDASEESALMRQDIAQLRTRVKEEGFKWAHLSALSRFALRRFRSKRKKKEDEE